LGRDLTRVNLNFSNELLTQIDEYAKMVGVNRTAAISVLVSQALTAYKMTNTLDYMIQADKAEKAFKALNGQA
jgi:metal-responsive CopG/Arc/MetJ family transcriptional regulator